MSEEGDLPTLSDIISNWVGFKLPTIIPLPQTRRNFDKAVGKILLAAGENAEARIKSSTGQVKAKGKIAIEGLYRTEEEKRKIGNRAEVVRVTVNELNSDSKTTDAQGEINEDWLNSFMRFAEDKSSEEMQNLFGRILAGEIRKPGSFSLRTVQFVSLLSKEEADAISVFLSYVINGNAVPMLGWDVPSGPEFATRIMMQDLGLASHPTRQSGGLSWSLEILPKTDGLLFGTKFGIIIKNESDRTIKLSLASQIISKSAQELIRIANPGSTNLDFLKALAEECFRKINMDDFYGALAGSLSIDIVQFTKLDIGWRYTAIQHDR
jgi:hypothetical protein